MRRFPIVLVLVALAACGKSASVGTPAPSDSPSPSESPAAFTPLPRASHPARPSTPPASFVAVTESGDIVVAETATGQIVRKVVPRSDRIGTIDAMSVAPGGKTLYFSTTIGHEDCAVWSVPLAGGTPKRIATGLSPAVSPDGAKLAFARVGCGQKGTTFTVRTLSTGAETTWKDDQELPADGVLDWAPDSRTLYLVQCGADTCGPVTVDTSRPAGSIQKGFIQPEDLDDRSFGWTGTVTRGSRLVTVVDYGDVGGDERYPMIEVDPAAKRIVAALYDDGREFRLHDFDASGEHLLIHRGETLNRWSAGNLFPLGDGFLSVRWIE